MRRYDLHTHDEDHETFLLMLTCGDARPDSAESIERLRACTVCRDDFEGMQRLAVDLQTWALADRDLQSDLGDRRQVAGSDLVAPYLRARMTERRERTRRWVPLAAAAALAVGVGAWVASEALQGDPPVGETLLGEGELSVAVQFDQDRTPVVVWPAAAPAGGRYELSWQAVGGGRGLDLPPERTKEHRWSPSAEQAAALPGDYKVVVTVLDAQDTPLSEGSVRVSAER